MVDYIVPHLALLVLVVSCNEVWQVCAQVPCELQNVAEHAYSCDVAQQTSAVLALGVAVGLVGVYAVSAHLLGHILLTHGLVARLKAVFDVTDSIVQLPCI